MQNLPNFKLFHNKASTTLDVVLHGISEGMDSMLINKIVEASKANGNSVVAFNFSFFERGEKKSSGVELEEERASLQSILEFCKAQEYTTIRLIGKSLGGIVAARFLQDVPVEEHSKYCIMFFGYDIGYINIKNFTGEMTIVQGSKDKYGNIEAVKKDLEGSMAKNINYIEIEGASHSYCNPENDEPIYVDEAVNSAFSNN